MKIFEISPTVNKEHISAISQLIADRTEYADSESKINTKSFVQLLNRMGIPISMEMLMDMKERGDLGPVIKDLNDQDVMFKGQKDIDPAEMDVGKAEKIVSNMAKRSSKKSIKK